MVISDGISDVCSTNIYVFFAFLAVALVTSNLTARIRAQAEAARVREARTAALYDFSRMVTGAASEDDILWAVVHHVASLAKADRKSTRLSSSHQCAYRLQTSG